ncbi:MAG TPA: TlyA family RNA methyltransferase [Anaerolineales bacterium]|nr:TlyA family RNA methyltransferase [Anaerolineales bacterium]
MAKKERLDILIYTRGLAESREKARRLIMAGEVMVAGQLVDKPGTLVPVGAAIDLKVGPRFVSRGGEKLLAALAEFKLQPVGWLCADVGASTGGFTDCLLQHGAAKVYAIDVGVGILDWKLRNDPRVVVMENTNARYVESLPEPVRLVTIDAAFISLKLLLPVVTKWLTPDGEIVALIKPQFEAGKDRVGKKGVVRDPEVHREVLMEVLRFAESIGLIARGLIRSPLLGPAGNVEFLAGLVGQGESQIDELVERVGTSHTNITG